MENLTINAENQQMLDNVIGNYGVDCKEKLNIDFSGAVELILEEIIGNQEEENEEEEEELDYNSDSDM